MMHSWTFKKKLAVGFSLIASIIALMSIFFIWTLRTVSESKDSIIQINFPRVLSAERLLTNIEELGKLNRTYILAPGPKELEEIIQTRNEFKAGLNQMKNYVDLSRDQGDRRVQESYDKIAHKFAEKVTTDDELFDIIKKNHDIENKKTFFLNRNLPQHNEVIAAIQELIDNENQAMKTSIKGATERSDKAMVISSWAGFIGVILCAGLSYLFSTLLGRQIGQAVQHIQNSSSELQAAATQQTAGTKEQVTSVNETTTTIKELLNTSRQIAESTQRVSRIAEQTADSARNGGIIVGRAQESIEAIVRQVDTIVTYMIDLGKKSQQIGGILEIINELSEQTNILAINATIEAVGAGESGKRFVVVADEIRKLADRVGTSTKDIRSLVEEIRAAVTTTIMATESGSKTVQAGTLQFSEVITSLKTISELVTTTTEAAKEIELSTKQQSTSVEQVNLAMNNISLAARESESGSSQTLQTVSQLAQLARSLNNLVQSQKPVIGNGA